MDLLQNGIDRAVIALWLGHESVDTTSIYLQADMTIKEQALERTATSSACARRYRPDDQLLAFLRRIAVKLPNSASSEGNFVFKSDDLLRLPSRRLMDRLRQPLHKAGWRGSFPLLVTSWEQPVATSPSVQLWIPDREDGVPLVEGIFEQHQAGTAARFTGAAPTDLSGDWQRRLAAEASRLASLFQNLGYFGRCSLDAILVGDDPASWQLRWIECNGRWGGVSVPMTLANRLVGDWRRRPFVVVDIRTAERELTKLLQEIGSDLLVPGVRETGAVVIAPTRIEGGTGLALMVLGETTTAARAQAEKIANRLSRT